MKRFLRGFVAVCAFALSAFAAEPATRAKTLPAAEKELLAATQTWVDAEVRRDEPALRVVLDEHFIATFGSGQPINRTDYIKAVGEGRNTMLSQQLTDETILVEGDTGVVVGTVDIRVKAQGNETTTRYRFTATYCKRSGHWAALALHMVNAPPKKS